MSELIAENVKAACDAEAQMLREFVALAENGIAKIREAIDAYERCESYESISDAQKKSAAAFRSIYDRLEMGDPWPNIDLEYVTTPHMRDDVSVRA